MVQSFYDFCGKSPFFDEDLLLNSSYPKFTECFQATVLVWVPCGLVWLLLPGYLYYLMSLEARSLPFSGINISKTFFSLILFVITGINLLFYANEEDNDDKYRPTAVFVAGSIQASTYLLVALLIQIERMRGIITSGVLFVFWLLSFVAGIIPLYTQYMEKKYESELYSFAMYQISFALIVLQLILTGFAERVQRRGYQELGKPVSPEVYASFPSRITFNWITSLVVKIYRSGIKDDELWDLHPRDQSARTIPVFQRTWLEEVMRYREKQRRAQAKQPRSPVNETSFTLNAERTPLVNGSKNKTYSTMNGDKEGNAKKGNEPSGSGPSLFKVLVKVFGRDIMVGWMNKFVYDLLQFVNPMVLNVLISYVESRGNPDAPAQQQWRGYVYAAAMFFVAMTQSVFFHQNFHIGMTAGMRIKSALIAAIYKKAMTMTSEARKNSTIGEIVNLMSVDCQRIQDITGYLWMLWSSPVQITLAMVLLWNTLGPSVLTGLAIMVLLIPVNGIIAMKQRKLQVLQMRYKDARIKLMNEVLNGMKVLKLYAWEPSFEKKVQDIRDKELDVLRKGAYLNAFSTFFWTTAPFIVTLATFATYILIDHTNYLDAQKAFVSLSLFSIIRFPINLLPMIISYVVQGNVSLGRIGKFLQSEDLDPDNVQRTEIADHAMSIDRGTFTWDKTMEPTLKDINLDIPDGQLVAVVGQVGSGKSSLVSAFLGEMEKLEGRVKVKGSVAYVPQQAWIQNDTVRGNILFGKPVDQHKYDQVIDACALKPDLEILQGGDLTEIGEKGINLSGGQKQRVSLARSVYNNADIYMLDDPLSAVDSHVGKHIFNKVIGSKGLLRNKTRILVTHGVHWLPMVDTIVVMVDGKISELGSYDELLSHDGTFAQFLKTYLTQHDDEEDEEDPEIQQIKSKILERVDSVTSGTDGQSEDDRPTRLRKTSKKEKPPLQRTISSIDDTAVKGDWKEKNDPKQVDKLIQVETSETGKVSWKVYMKYFYAIGGFSTLLIFGLFIIYQGAGIGSSIWLAQWTDNPYLKDTSHANETEYQNKNYMYLGVYGLLGVAQALIILFYALLAAVRMVRAAGLLHNGMLSNILKLPMSFFDTTPLGRIVNRFSRDAEVIDNTLPANFRMFMITFFGALSIFVVIIYSTPIFSAIIIPMAVLYYLMQIINPYATRGYYCQPSANSVDPDQTASNSPSDQGITALVMLEGVIHCLFALLTHIRRLHFIPRVEREMFYIPTSRQLKRIESTTRSPIYSHFGESISGASTIRGYRLEQTFMEESKNKVDKNMTFYFAGIASNRWLGFRLEFLGNCIVLAAAIFAVVTPGNTGGLAGLSISYALQVTGALNFLVRNTSDVETNIVSVERVKEYTEAETEAEWVQPFHRPPKDWPQRGEMRFNNYSTRYREGLDLVLKGISCDIAGGERVGIVGRTGAGKSSLTVALFRLIEAAGGNIVIDGQRISEMGLHDLRSKLTILPQDPVLFSGSLRMNLDPFDNFADAEIWRVLDHAHLKSFVSGLPDNLQHECGEGGQNLSVGQRQLVCLARTLLRKTKILVLDEATAAVDMETDDLIQKTIREEFRGCTILTIAHRLNTIMDYDKIMVLDQGLIKEFDSPVALLGDTSTIFYSMAKQANLV